MKIGDYIIVTVVIMTTVIIFLFNGKFAITQSSTMLEVRSNGTIVDRFILPLELEKTYDTKYGENTILIKGCSVEIIDANCPNKICLKSKAISKQNEAIVCVPNRFSIEIVGGTEEVDAIAN